MRPYTRNLGQPAFEAVSKALGSDCVIPRAGAILTVRASDSSHEYHSVCGERDGGAMSVCIVEEERQRNRCRPAATLRADGGCGRSPRRSQAPSANVMVFMGRDTRASWASARTDGDSPLLAWVSKGPGFPHRGGQARSPHCPIPKENRAGIGH